MRAGADQLHDVVGVGEEVFSGSKRVAAVATSVVHAQGEALLGERALCLPFVVAESEGSVHQDHRGAVTPRLDVEGAAGGIGCGMGEVDVHHQSFRSGRYGDDADREVVRRGLTT